ncbi:DUF2164 domain-containing protein [Bacillus gobiensis]|uniref:DUF2164 domain-containing protein n=1 Tax=Bacillus gobiensis TaxID=1441095 RepID=UPI003D1D38F2
MGDIMHLSLKKEEKDQIISDIQQFFYEERDEEIGELAAEQAFAFFKEKLGPYFYNQGVSDCRKVLEDKAQAMEDELFALEKRIHNHR